MKTTTTILICSSLAAVNASQNARFRSYLHDQKTQPSLIGAVQTATSDEFYNLGSHSSEEETNNYAALSDDSSYTYQFRLDFSSPLVVDMTGKLQIDDCIGWDSFVSPTNFTWYGFNFQLPEDAKGLGGSYNTDLAQPLKEDGFVQPFNFTSHDVVIYNFTTSADRPVIRARMNNDLFWNTFTFDFTNESYVEHQSVQPVSCIAEESNNGTSRTYTTVVYPTVTVSLERLSAPAPAPEPSSSSMASSFSAITALASSAFLLL